MKKGLKFVARMLMQQAAFTINGHDSFLRKFLIAERGVKQIRSVLNEVLRIRRSNLFPDLQNLALDISKMVFDAEP